MHGLGNDFVVLDGLAPEGRGLAERGDMPDLARAMCDRRLGVGADGVLLICEPTERGAKHAFRQRIWNADGGEAEMCGNGLRCTTRLALERGSVTPDADGAVTIETGAGMLKAWAERDGGGGTGGGGAVRSVTVDMGAPSFDLGVIGADERRLGRSARAEERRVSDLDAVLVSMGNPHMVVFLSEPVAKFPLEARGPELERHAAFPQRINVQIVNAVEPGLAVMRTWERGAGMTLACGTGACAVIAAGVATGRLSREATLRLPGGELRMKWDERTGRILKTGPAAHVFEGVWPG